MKNLLVAVSLIKSNIRNDIILNRNVGVIEIPNQKLNSKGIVSDIPEITRSSCKKNMRYKKR